jgi:hypothetical protein
MQTMRRLSVVTVLTLTAGSWLMAEQAARPAATSGLPAATGAMTLTVDSIMRGPALVGSAPTGVRWSRDSSKAYFTWQKAGEERAATFVVNRDGTGLRQLTEEESRNLDVPQAGRFDRAGRRVLVAEGGDLVIIDAESGARSLLTRTAVTESNPRWARNDTAVTFQRDGNLYLMSLVAGPGPSMVQLTDIVAAGAAPAAAAGAAGGRAGAAGERGGGAGRAGGIGVTGQLTEAQRLLREQELALMDYLRKQQEGRQGGAGRGGRAGGPAGPPQTPIARFALTERQTIADLLLSGDERYVWIGVNERPELTPRGQDTPNYVTQSSYPEMIPGRANVGDVESVRKLAIPT